jgi:hypothetical protein
MFTNEQIRTAMEGLVKQKGENHTSFGRYADPLTGQGACFLGALCQFMGRGIPAEGTSATNVLGVGAVSRHMEVAFAVAQSLNDSHFEWKYVLKAVDMVIATPEERLFKETGANCPCGCTSSSPNVRQIMDDIRAIRMIDHTRERKQGPLMANGGIIQPIGKIALKDLDFSGIVTFSTAMNELTVSMSNLVGSFSTPTYVPAQKDHALVA